ncbi:MAG TPA: hypothetical protein VGN57_15960 [Pirellulaceae bacterium]|jgi:hypothetical protein|nr:hypothetical protein [Pirellulaceae bacterium]
MFRSTLAAIVAVLSAFGGSACSGSELDVPQARLAIRASEGAAPNRLVVVLEIENQGQTAFTWDKEFSALVEWSVAAADGIALETVAVAKAEGEPKKDRFVKLQPGESLSKEFELTKSALAFHHARGSFADPAGGSVIVPTAGEEFVRYVVAEDVRTVKVSAAYRGDDSDAADGFAVYFGVRPEKAGLPMERLETEVVKIAVPE